MSLGDKNKLNRIEELKSKLFSKNFQQKTERHTSFLQTSQNDIPDSWESSEEPKIGASERFFMRSSLFKKFFIFSIIFFVLAVGYASYMFFAGGNTVSNNNIDLSILGNTFVAGGEELSLQVGIVNKNNSPLELVDLIVEYPKSSGGDFTQDTERLRESIGLIPAGAVKNQNIKVILFGEQGSTRKIKVSIEYRVGGSNAIFVKEKFYEVTLNSSPVDLAIDAPTEISPNQDITLNVKTTLNSTRAALGMLLKVDYPVGFQFISSDVEPSFGNNVWSLGDLAPGIERNISIKGKMIDVFDGEEKTFRAWTGSKSPSDKSAIEIVFNSLGHTIAINKPFIEARLSVNGVYRTEYASDTKTSITGEIAWVNNLSTKINDLEIRAKLSGNALSRKGVNTEDGFYDSAKDIIIWNKNFTRDFAEVQPGASGTVTFSLSPMASNLVSVLSDPLINIEVSISGKQSEEGNTQKELKNSESKIIRVISDVGFATKALYYSGPFKNEGPIPPQAEKETTYTIVWTITNTTNNVSKGQVKSSLPPWARFMGTISPLAEDLNYNASTKELIWNTGKISKGTGIDGGSKEVSFQIALSPSLSQVDTSPVLINDTTLTGFDDFAKVNIRVNKQSLSTILSNDPAVPNTGYRVVE
jgi:hypothetical protein